ncbi:MAG: hypothetical protein EOP06_00125 [Proteobacteria bacterium]|nr:MAG: hypothetical protein EOP06_00125 [Pseudomonadota bacterium]
MMLVESRVQLNEHLKWRALLGGGLLLSALMLQSTDVRAVSDDFCLSTNAYCQQGAKSTPTQNQDTPNPSKSGLGSLIGFGSNPAAVSTSRAIGIGAVYYKIRPSYVLVSGTGQIGAAISPSNGDDTFFGSPSFETEVDYLRRQKESLPFAQQKFVLGVAYAVVDNELSGYRRFQITLGAVGRYIVDAKAVTPGGGLALAAGPLVLAAAASLDETKLSADGSTPSMILKNTTLSYNGNITVGSMTLDYTRLILTPELAKELSVDLANASLSIKGFLISAAYRVEKSDRKVFEKESLTLRPRFRKEKIFGGVQIPILPFSQLGVFYNYYLLDEFSVGLTIFF